MGTLRKDLIQDVWPDKLLYGSIMLFVTGIAGVLHSAVYVIFEDITYSDNVWKIIREWPPEAALGLTLASTACAIMALRKLNPFWGFAGGAAGVASLSLVGVGSIFSLLALGFITWSKIEGEDRAIATSQLTADDWPDKSLAASLLALMSGLVTVGWGYVVVSKTVAFAGSQYVLVGGLEIAAGIISVAAAILLYRQRGAWLGLVAGITGIVAVGGYVLAPILSLASLILLYKAWSEEEFVGRTPPPSAPPPGKSTRAPRS